MRLNRICCENAFFDKRCNKLEIWLKERGYSDKLVRGQILKARKFSRSEVLNKRKRTGNKCIIVVNITYHAVFSKLKNVLSEIHLLLTPIIGLEEQKVKYSNKKKRYSCEREGSTPGKEERLLQIMRRY